MQYTAPYRWPLFLPASPVSYTHLKESTTTYTGVDARFENESYAYYKLGETPAYYITAWYNLLSGKWEFGKVHATETTVELSLIHI